MINTVVFDIGNVLTKFDWKGFLDQFPYHEQIKQRIAQATVQSPLWNELDRGVWTLEEVICGFVKNAPDIENEIREVFSSFKGIVKRVDYAIPWIEDLKARGYKVLVLSNFPEYAHYQCMDALDFLDHVDGGILSYRDKVIKPDPAIYQLLIERYQLVPENCVFLDDLERNLIPAGEKGFHTILFQTKQQANDDLEELLHGNL